MSVESEPNAVVENPMVEYLNSLRTQDRGTNPTYIHENRATFVGPLRAKHPWFPSDDELLITTKLDELVRELATEHARFDVIFLTGDAGDGKTAVCAALAKLVGFKGELRKSVEHLGAWTIVKDASELTADEVEGVLRGQHLERTDSAPRLLVAINEGRLRRIAEKLYPQGHPFRSRILEPALEPTLTAERAVQLDVAMQEDRVLVLNFRHRAFVRTAVHSLLERWTASRVWEESPACRSCPARDRCTIVANARDLRDDALRARIADVLMSVLLSGQRLPLRRLQAFLALAVTGGLACEHLQRGPLADPDAALERVRYRFYEAIFRCEKREPVNVEPEAVCFALRPLDPGGTSDRAFDELLALDASGAAEPEAMKKARQPEREALEAIRSGGDDDRLDLLADRLSKFTKAMRRWRALTSRDVDSELDRWLRAIRLLEDYAVHGDGTALRDAVVDALNRLHLVENRKTDRLTQRQLDAAGFRQPTRRALELDLGTELEVGLEKTPALPPETVAPMFEHAASDVTLVAWHPQKQSVRARLLLDIRLVHALLGVLEGFHHVAALGAYRRDLARFFANVAEMATRAGAQPTLAVLSGHTRIRVRGKAGKLDFQAE